MLYSIQSQFKANTSISEATKLIISEFGIKNIEKQGKKTQYIIQKEKSRVLGLTEDLKFLQGQLVYEEEIFRRIFIQYTALINETQFCGGNCTRLMVPFLKFNQAC